MKFIYIAVIELFFIINFSISQEIHYEPLQSGFNVYVGSASAKDTKTNSLGISYLHSGKFFIYAGISEGKYEDEVEIVGDVYGGGIGVVSRNQNFPLSSIITFDYSYANYEVFSLYRSIYSFGVSIFSDFYKNEMFNFIPELFMSYGVSFTGMDEVSYIAMERTEKNFFYGIRLNVCYMCKKNVWPSFGIYGAMNEQTPLFGVNFGLSFHLNKRGAI